MVPDDEAVRKLAPSHKDIPEWMSRGPYSPFVTGERIAGTAGRRMVRISQPPGSYPDPPLDDYSLILLTGSDGGIGEADLGDGAQVVSLSSGLMAVAPHSTACSHVAHSHLETMALGLSREQVARLGEEVTGHKTSHLGRCHTFFRDLTIENLCLRLWEELKADNPFDALFSDQVLLTVIMMLLKRNGSKVNERSGKRLPPARLKRVLEYLHDNLSEPLRLSELANVAGLSEFHFARLFKGSTGSAPFQYLIDLRVQRARQLIEAGTMPLAQIALEVGFSSQSHLNRHYKRLVGCTPAKTRR